MTDGAVDVPTAGEVAALAEASYQKVVASIRKGSNSGGSSSLVGADVFVCFELPVAFLSVRGP